MPIPIFKLNFMNLVKSQIPQVGLNGFILVNLFFVWRQLEFAFFGALTSVGALFIFTEIFSKDYVASIRLLENNMLK